MEKRKGVITGILIVIITLISLYFDAEIVKGIASLRFDSLNNFFLVITTLSSKVLVALFLTCLLVWSAQKRKWILPLWITIGLTAVVSFVFKFLVQRMRPYQEGIVSLVSSTLQEVSHSAWNFSFVSSHAMLGFCAIPLISRHFPRFKYIWIIFASLVAISRVYLGLHYLSDIIAGAIIGYLIGAIIVAFEKKKRISEKIYFKIFGK